MNKKRTKYNPGDIVGDYGNQLLEITRVTGYGHRYGLFLCGECHKNTFEAKIYHVSSNRTIRCKECHKKAFSGKNNPNFVDLTGKRFGKMTAIKYVGTKKYGHTSSGNLLSRSLWLCKCDCGRSKIVDSNCLNRGLVSSCGYCSLNSKGEYKLYTLLESLNIYFISQYLFDDCRNPKTNKKMRFDFYLPDYNCCIEYDGISHYKPNEYGSWNTEKSVKDTQYRDKVKDEYCFSHNIKMIRIPYWDYDILDENYLLSKIS